MKPRPVSFLFIRLSIQQHLANKIQQWEITLALCHLNEKNGIYGLG